MPWIAFARQGTKGYLAAEFQREGLSIPEACTVAGLGRTSVYDAIASGDLPARKFGKRTIILRGDLNNFLAGLPLMTIAR